MKRQFPEMMAEVERRYRELVTARTFKCDQAPGALARRPGVYLFSEGGEPLYVGRTDDLRKRLMSHRHRAHGTATFAFLLARRETNMLQASYQPVGSRADLLRSNPAFSHAFDEARKRIGRMDVQTVEENDPVRQALLEIYAAVASDAKYNDFENH